MERMANHCKRQEILLANAEDELKEEEQEQPQKDEVQELEAVLATDARSEVRSKEIVEISKEKAPQIKQFQLVTTSEENAITREKEESRDGYNYKQNPVVEEQKIYQDAETTEKEGRKWTKKQKKMKDELDPGGELGPVMTIEEGPGFANLGNTCLIHAVLQCLAHSLPLVQVIHSCHHATPCAHGSKGLCALCALIDRVERSLASSGDLKIKDKSLLPQDLSWELEEVDTFPSALESFTKVEKIEDSETTCKYKNCMEERLKNEQFMRDEAPSVSVFHFKTFNTSGSLIEKVDKHVEFPFELDLQPYSIACRNSNVEGLIANFNFSTLWARFSQEGSMLWAYMGGMWFICEGRVCSGSRLSGSLVVII